MTAIDYLRAGFYCATGAMAAICISCFFIFLIIITFLGDKNL